ncbi:hypothetical protein ACIQM0_15795 [Streptomyces sp. NPDC091387]|uniref:hypothetical protein n=1 Tax=Streptomyces sp. NPDC091387 TaxID=3365998 RepID=UPI0037F56AD9
MDRVDAAAAWAEEHRPPWFNRGPLPLHVFGCNGELPTYTRNDVPDSPLRLSDAPAVIAGVAALVEPNKAVGETWSLFQPQVEAW